MNDPFHLERFVVAQKPVYAAIAGELRAGHKQSHWMWFIFPQLKGLGKSEDAEHYGIASVDEARAYLAHKTLGPRLRECCELLLAIPRQPIEGILGQIDALKLRSSMTLFAAADPDEPLFTRLLNRYYMGQNDTLTLRLLWAHERKSA